MTRTNTKDAAPDLRTTVRDYVRLQDALLEELHRSVGGPLGPNPRTWPQRGAVLVSGSAWGYRRHGLGYTFTEIAGPRRVEAHELIDHEPYPFDAYRLREYLSDLGIERVRSDGDLHEVEIFALQEGLDRLVAAGVLTIDPRSASSPVRSYTVIWPLESACEQVGLPILTARELRLRTFESTFGRELGWYVERGGRRLFRLSDAWPEEMFWDSYRIEGAEVSGDGALLYSDEFWNDPGLSFRNRVTSEVVQDVIVRAPPSSNDQRIYVRGLYSRLRPTTFERLLLLLRARRRKHGHRWKR